MTGITGRVYVIRQMDNLTETAVELQKIPCLSGLSGEDINTLARSAELRRYSRNDTVFEESEPVKSFFIVRKGSIKLCKTSDEGREFIVKVIREGDHFCFVPVFIRSTHQVSSIAAEESTLVTIPAEVFTKVLTENIGPMGFRIIEGLCVRLRHLTDMVEDLTFKDVEYRVLTNLLRLACESSRGENIAVIRMTHQDIASMTGTVREVVSRITTKLKKEKVILKSSVRSFTIDRRMLLRLLSNK